VVERQLRLIPGVADIVSFGGLIKQYEVNPDLGKLRDYKVTLQQLFSALQRGNARRRKLPRTGQAAVSDPRHRAAAFRRRDRQHRGR